MNEYDWTGTWDAPQHGQYVIRENGREMEPYEVIDLITTYDDLHEQFKNLQRENNRLKSNLIALGG